MMSVVVNAHLFRSLTGSLRLIWIHVTIPAANLEKLFAAQTGGNALF